MNDDGRDGTLFGQRVSAEFVMVLIAQLGGVAEVNMFQEIERMRAAGVRIIAEPKFFLTAPDVYRLVDRDGRAWPPAPEPWCDCCSAGNHTTLCRGACAVADQCCHPLYHTDPERAERERLEEVSRNLGEVLPTATAAEVRPVFEDEEERMA